MGIRSRAKRPPLFRGLVIIETHSLARESVYGISVLRGGRESDNENWTCGQRVKGRTGTGLRGTVECEPCSANVGTRSGSLSVSLNLNPHPLKAEGAAPNKHSPPAKCPDSQMSSDRHSLDGEFRLGFAFGGYTPVVFSGVRKAYWNEWVTGGREMSVWKLMKMLGMGEGVFELGDVFIKKYSGFLLSCQQVLNGYSNEELEEVEEEVDSRKLKVESGGG